MRFGNVDGKKLGYFLKPFAALVNVDQKLGLFDIASVVVTNS